MKQEAEDFLEKPAKPKDLLAAIERAIAHDGALSVDRQARDELRRRYDELTEREQEVMRLVITGLLKKQIAAELGISEKTVKVHRARVMEKMQVKSVAALVHLTSRMETLVAGIAATVVTVRS